MPYSLFIVLVLLSSQIFAADSVEGEWINDDKSVRIKLSVTNGKLSGAISHVKDPARAKDTRNPNAAKRGRNLVGLKTLNGFTKKDNIWQGGTIYDSSNGKIYKGKVWTQNGKLIMRGYVGVSLMGRTTNWTRYK